MQASNLYFAITLGVLDHGDRQRKANGAIPLEPACFIERFDRSKSVADIDEINGDEIGGSRVKSFTFVDSIEKEGVVVDLVR